MTSPIPGLGWMTAFGVTSIAARTVTTHASYSKAVVAINAQPMIGATS
jgi:hypothetical protein